MGTDFLGPEPKKSVPNRNGRIYAKKKFKSYGKSQ